VQGVCTQPGEGTQVTWGTGRNGGRRGHVMCSEGGRVGIRVWGQAMANRATGGSCLPPITEGADRNGRSEPIGGSGCGPTSRMQCKRRALRRRRRRGQRRRGERDGGRGGWAGRRVAAGVAGEMGEMAKWPEAMSRYLVCADCKGPSELQERKTTTAAPAPAADSESAPQWRRLCSSSRCARRLRRPPTADPAQGNKSFSPFSNLADGDALTRTWKGPLFAPYMHAHAHPPQYAPRSPLISSRASDSRTSAGVSGTSTPSWSTRTQTTTPRPAASSKSSPATPASA
jgi:hypothetical protein